MSTVADTLIALNIKDWNLKGTPTTEAEFNTMFLKVKGVDKNGTAITSSNTSDFGVTWKEITDKQKELQTAYDNNKYQRDRAESYPSIADQLDDLYHNGIDGWKTTIKAIKDKYPKG